MSRILINKLKKSLNSLNPLDEIKEIISQYEELYRLAEWRKDIILEGDNLKKYEKELHKIAEEMKKNGYVPPIHVYDIEKDIIDYLNNFEDIDENE